MTRLLVLVLVLAVGSGACGSSSAPAPTTGASAARPAAPPAAPSPIVDEGTIRSRFRDCGNEFVGQVVDAPGATCAAVCKVYGYGRCRGRAGQADLNACVDKQPVVGPCDQPFEPGATSQCDCTNLPPPTPT